MELLFVANLVMHVCFLTMCVISRISGLSRRMHDFQHTDYLRQCCETLYDYQEFESDRNLVALTQLQRLVSKAISVFPNHEFNADTDRSVRPDFYAPLYMTLSSLRSELETLKANESFDIEDDGK